MDTYESWGYAHVGVTCFTTLGTLVIGSVICAKARVRSDPARMGFRWLKYASALYFLGYVLLAASSIMDRLSDPPREPVIFGYAAALTGGSLVHFADLCLLLTFVELGNGFTYALTKTPGRREGLLRKGTYGAVTLLFILEIAYVGFHGSVRAKIFDIVEDPGQSIPADVWPVVQPLYAQLYDANRINLVWAVLYCVFSAVALVQAAKVQHKYRGTQGSRTVSLYLASAVVTLFPRKFYTMIYTGLSSNPYFYVTMESYVVTDIVLRQFVILVTLILLLVAATRTLNGLWTTPQPWMGGAPVVAGMPWQHSYSSVGYESQAVSYDPGQAQVSELDGQQPHVYEMGNHEVKA